jgi:hypothetical protein
MNIKHIWTYILVGISLTVIFTSCFSKSEKQNDNYSSSDNNRNYESSSSNYSEEDNNDFTSNSYDRNPTTISKADRDCSNAYSAADDAYSYCKKAYNSDDWEDTKRYLKKAMSSFDDAMTYAQDDDCDCDNAHSAADDGYSYAKKGYNSDDWDDIKNYAKKAKNSADDAMSYANDCND